MTNQEPDLVDQVMTELQQNNGNIESLNKDEDVIIENKNLSSNTAVNEQQLNEAVNVLNDRQAVKDVINDNITTDELVSEAQKTPIVLNPIQKPKKNIFNQIKNPIIVSMLYFIVNKDVIVNFINSMIDPTSFTNILVKSIIMGILFYITQLFTPDF